MTHGYPPEAIRRLAAFHVVRLGFAAVHEDRLNLKLPAQDRRVASAELLAQHVLADLA